jgi:Tfp pilus assembly protein PilO
MDEKIKTDLINNLKKIIPVEKIRGFLSDKSTALSLLVPALIAVFYLGLFVRPTMKRFFRLLPEASQLKAKIIKVEKDWENIEALKGRVSQSHEKIGTYERKLPVEKEVPAVLEFLSQAARKMDVRITEIKPVDQDKDEPGIHSLYYRIPILLKAECGYHQLGRFLNKLESADRFVKIDDIKITTNPAQPAIHDVKLVVVTYVMEKE